ncbi:hypothetical protein EJ02DRAFT_460602 [Clathrospora elynae]|uniref:Uncharacterized protein n=1 Tax=Clathrospora elynae TaxID=706981 RepID=A0A6A5S9U6_9PLEO|nr:hypothetical protein EJ02DRAFT_460602 [Clathrospora elynae]
MAAVLLANTELFANLAIKLGLLGFGLGTSPETIDLLHGGVKGAITEATVPNTCVFSVTGIPGTVDPYKQADVSISAWLRCEDQTSLLGSWIGVSSDQDLLVSDSRVGDIRLNFQSSKFPSYPFPGDLIIYNPVWVDHANEGGIGMINCLRTSKVGGIDGKDCSGKHVSLKACDEGFAGGETGVINDENIQKFGWIYVLGLPVSGVDPCPSK